MHHQSGLKGYSSMSQKAHREGKKRFNGIPTKASSEWVERIQFNVSKRHIEKARRDSKGSPFSMGGKEHSSLYVTFFTNLTTYVKSFFL